MTKVILDCDPGHDDAVALLLALASPELVLLGVTTVFGNHSLSETTANAIRVLDHVGRPDIPVTAGASRPLVRELAAATSGESTVDEAGLPASARRPERGHAIDWIASVVSASPSPVTLVSTAPLTNVALLLARFPELDRILERVVLMGGAIGEGNVTPAAEFNIWSDPEAARRVFTSGIELTMVGLDVTDRALITEIEIDQLAQTGDAGRLAADLYRICLRNQTTRHGGHGVPVHDAVVVAHLVDAALLETQHCGVVVDTGPEPSRGRTYVDRRGLTGWEPNCEVAIGIHADRFLELLVQRISALR